jgi:hypothetical protein
MATYLYFKGGRNKNLITFLRDFKKSCIFGIIGAHTQKWRVNFFPKLLEMRTLTWFEKLIVKQNGT